MPIRGRSPRLGWFGFREGLLLEASRSERSTGNSSLDRVEATLAGCRAKHERGVEYLKALDTEVSEYLGADPRPYRMWGNFERDRREYVLRGEIIEPIEDPMRWSLMLGDGLHNLRSALDHLIWQLVILNTGKEGGTGNLFPIATTGPRYWSISKNGRQSLRDRALKGVADKHRALTDGLQPYRAPQHGSMQLLRTLQALSNHDKHRLLNPVLCAIDAPGDDGVRFTWNEDAGSPVGAMARTFAAEGEAEIMTIEFSCPGDDPYVGMDREPPVNIGFGESPIRASDLPRLGVTVGEIIEAFAPYF